MEIADLLDSAAVVYQVALTKIDKLKPGATERLQAEISVTLAKRPAAMPVVLTTSALKGAGVVELRAEIGRLARH